MGFHLIRITGICLLLSFFIFYPFLPGEYDALSITLSFMAQVFIITGLLLVPISVAWFIYDGTKRNNNSTDSRANAGYYFAMAALVVFLLMAIMASIAAYGNRNKILAFATFVFCLYILFKLFRRIKTMRTAGREKWKTIALYVLIIPIVVAGLRFLLMVPAVTFSRTHVIERSQPLIKDIEMFREREGQYPVSLLSVWEDYKPGMTGVKQYHYEQAGDAYNLYFEQLTYDLTAREMVMYNKLDQQQATSHNQDLLEYSGSRLDLQRGYFKAKDLPQPHWKFFWFD